MSDCIFCKIAKKEQKASIIFENDNFVAFKDINPKAPIHYLLIPKTHIESINSLEDQDLAGQLLLTAKKIAAKLEIKDSGYKLIFNVGRGGGQEVNHLHLHILGGWKN
jgi:histidine triad (HIT) family protein